MNHLDLGLLRRALDEPDALLGAARRHLDGCMTCRRASARLRATAETAAAVLGTAPGSEALAADVGRGTAVRSFALASRATTAPARRPGALWPGAVAAAAIVALGFVPPVRTVAAQFLAIFEPRQFVALPLSSADMTALHALPDLRRYGTMRHLSPERSTEATDAASAARVAGMRVRVPAFVPPGVPARPRYRIASRTTTTFTFDAVKAAAAAAADGRTLAPLPHGLDGTTLEATVGPAVIAAYLSPGESVGRPDPRDRNGRAGRRRERGWPKLLVAQMPAPVVVSTGASAAVLLGYLAAQPGMPAALAAELRAIGDPTSTLPIPIPIDEATATPVIVQGVRGLGVGDNTGVGAGVVWERDGYVYGVAGALPASTVLAVADSLH